MFIMSLRPPSPSKRRSRRMRKKLRIGEFKESGFPVAIQLRDGADPEKQMDLLDAFIVELIEPRGLAFGGGNEHGYITRFGRGSATEADRQAVETWLRQREDVDSVQIGPLEDAWYGHGTTAP